MRKYSGAFSKLGVSMTSILFYCDIQVLCNSRYNESVGIVTIPEASLGSIFSIHVYIEFPTKEQIQHPSTAQVA